MIRIKENIKLILVMNVYASELILVMKCICKRGPFPLFLPQGCSWTSVAKGCRNDGIKEWERGTTWVSFKKKIVYLFILFVRDIKYVPSIAATIMLL